MERVEQGWRDELCRVMRMVRREREGEGRGINCAGL